MPIATQTKPCATVVIEWENIQVAEHARCLEMLRRLTRQIDEVYATDLAAGAFEVILLYNSETCSADDVHNTVDPFFPPAKPHCILRVEATPKLSYYEQKNRGAELASGDILVFIDSDVIPEENWLRSLLASFADRSVQLVCGNTYLTTEDLYSKTFALFWYFPLRSTTDVFETRRIFFANNYAVRRDVCRAYPFVRVPGTARGWCVAAAKRFRDNGIPIHYNSAARVSHPAPFGFSHFFNRALVQGRDLVLNGRARGKGGLLRSVHKVALLPGRAVWKVLRNRRKVGLSLVETPAALTIAFTYNSLAVAGYLVTLVAPGYTTRHWQI